MGLGIYNVIEILLAPHSLADSMEFHSKYKHPFP
jgi:hypothetical protein